MILSRCYYKSSKNSPNPLLGNLAKTTAEEISHLIQNGMFCHSFGPLGQKKKLQKFIAPSSPFLLSIHLTWLTMHAHLPCMLAGMRRSRGLAIINSKEKGNIIKKITLIISKHIKQVIRLGLEKHIYNKLPLKFKIQNCCYVKAVFGKN